MRLEKEVNGIKLYINFPVENLLDAISQERVDWEEEFDDVINSYDKKCSPEDVKKNIDKMIEKILYYQEKGIDELFKLLPLKKNNKISKSSKPVLFCLDYGRWIDECYGWKTYELRLEGVNELEAEVRLNYTTVHY